MAGHMLRRHMGISTILGTILRLYREHSGRIDVIAETLTKRDRLWIQWMDRT
jgi:hypothetical protein